jgi:hypothetical protein
MSPHFHPIALLHKITVDTYYRHLFRIVEIWKKAADDNTAQRLTLSNWRTIHRADRHARANVMELRRVLNLIGSDENLVSPEETKVLSASNNNPGIV